MFSDYYQRNSKNCPDIAAVFLNDSPYIFFWHTQFYNKSVYSNNIICTSNDKVFFGLQKVYIELVFLNNFIINLLIALIASRFTKAQVKWGRFALSAGVGGVYACAVFGAKGIAVSIVSKLVVSFVMCMIAYYAKGEKGFLKNTGAFYVTSFVFAGAIYACLFCLGEPAAYGAAIVVPPLTLAILTGLGVGTILVLAMSRVHKRTMQRESLSEDMTLEYNGRQICLKAYTDTGNMVGEPLSGLGVVFITATAATALFGKDTVDLMQGHGDTVTERLRIVPCTTASGPSVFYGMEIDCARLKDASSGARAVVCIAKGTLAGGCGAIVGSAMMDELKKGAQNDKDSTAKTCGLGAAAPQGSGKCRLYRRQRGASAAAVTAGGSAASHVASARGQDGEACADRAKLKAGGVHRAQV